MIFIVSLGFVVVLSSFLDWNSAKFNVKGVVSKGASEDSYLKKIHFYKMNLGHKELYFMADELTKNEFDNSSLFFNPRGDIFNDKGEPIFYSAQKGEYDGQSKKLLLVEDVILRKNQSSVKSNFLTFDSLKNMLYFRGNARVFDLFKKSDGSLYITADLVSSDLNKNEFFFEQNVVGKVLRRREYEEKVDFGSDELLFVEGSALVKLSGNVSIKKQGLTSTAQRGEIFLENYNKKLKYFVLYDDVKVEEMVTLPGRKSPLIRKAFGEKLEGIMGEQKVILTGNPKVYQEGDIVRGNKIILRQDVEAIEIDEAKTNFKLKRNDI